MTPLEPAKQELLDTDSVFRGLFEEHQECKRRLEVIRQKALFSEEDEIEIKRLKVHKLHLKDRMAGKLRQRAQNSGRPQAPA
ncbi:MAG: YdcH family protein [Acidobacteriota bacterium]